MKLLNIEQNLTNVKLDLNMEKYFETIILICKKIVCTR